MYNIATVCVLTYRRFGESSGPVGSSPKKQVCISQ